MAETRPRRRGHTFAHVHNWRRQPNTSASDVNAVVCCTTNARRTCNRCALCICGQRTKNVVGLVAVALSLRYVYAPHLHTTYDVGILWTNRHVPCMYKTMYKSNTSIQMRLCALLTSLFLCCSRTFWHTARYKMVYGSVVVSLAVEVFIMQCTKCSR